MNLIPGLGLRASEEAEVLGIDDAEIGEFAVSHFYVQLELYQCLIKHSTTTLSLLETLSMATPSMTLTPSTLASATPRSYNMKKPSLPQAPMIPTSQINHLQLLGGLQHAFGSGGKPLYV